MQSEIRCQNFINQDLTFLQPSQIYPDRQPHPALDNIEKTQDNTVEDNPDTGHEAEQAVSTVGTSPWPYPRTTEKRNEDPKVTLAELLGLSSCQGYAQTPLQTLDGLYVNQPS